MVKGGGTDNHYHYGVAAPLATHYEALFAPVRTRIALTRNPGKSQAKQPGKAKSRTRIALTRNPGKAQECPLYGIHLTLSKKNCDGGMT